MEDKFRVLVEQLCAKFSGYDAKFSAIDATLACDEPVAVSERVRRLEMKHTAAT